MTLFHTLLIAHIAGGAVALVSGPIPILSRKGSTVHRRAGWVYACAMTLAAAAGLVLALLHWSLLLLVIAVFTAFLVFCGLRSIRFSRGVAPAQMDDAACVAAIGFSFWLLWHGTGAWDILSLFFGIGGWILAARQWRALRSPKTQWLIVHLTSMGAAYIATVTAFLVVNITFLPRPVVFIGPALIGTVLVTLAAVRQRRAGLMRRGGLTA